MLLPPPGPLVKSCVDSFPYLYLEAALQPITRTVLRISLTLTPGFEWKEKTHGQMLRWIILVEDGAREHIYHNEVWWHGGGRGVGGACTTG